MGKGSMEGHPDRETMWIENPWQSVLQTHQKSKQGHTTHSIRDVESGPESRAGCEKRRTQGTG